jgi:drug/metabolite transporter (DMT)-like permease
MAVGSKAELHRNLPGRALVYMVLGVASFSLLDAGAKWLTQSYGIAQIIFLGRIFTLALILGVTLPHGGIRQFRTGRPGRHLARAITSVLTMATFFWALSLMPLANVVALTFAAPLIMTVLSVFVLRESVGGRRWGAVAVGFIGVLIILRPTGDAFDWTALIPLACALFYAISIIVSRQLTATESTENLMLWVSVAAIVSTAPFLPGEWITPDPFALAIFAFTGFASGAGQFFMVRAFRYGEVSMLAPIEYSALIWAAALGFIIWGDVPAWPIWVGAVILIGSSFYIARRETRRARQRLTIQASMPGEGAP